MTTIRIEDEVEIRRPRGDVFDFMSDHDHLPAWTVGVKRAKRTSAGPIGVGTTYHVVGRVLGRRVESTYELTEFEPSTRFSGRMTSSVFSFEETYHFEGDGGRTTVRLSAEAAPGRRFRLLGPFLGVAIERQIRADHHRLKSILERRRRKVATPSARRAPAAPPAVGAPVEPPPPEALREG